MFSTVKYGHIKTGLPRCQYCNMKEGLLRCNIFNCLLEYLSSGTMMLFSSTFLSSSSTLALLRYTTARSLEKSTHGL